MRIAPTQQECYPDDIGGLIKKFGDELVCSVCLNVYEDPVLTPCNHAFCRECIERAVNLTKKGSAVPLNQCPVCKSKATKRSLNPSTRLAALAKGYEQLAREFSRIIGDDNWSFAAGLKGSESNYTGGGQPLENLSQLFPHPEKPKPEIVVPEPIAEIETVPSSPLIHAGEDLDLGFNTLAALENIELPSTPDIFKTKRPRDEKENFELADNVGRSGSQKHTIKAAQTKQKDITQAVTPVSRIKLKGRTIKVEAMSTPAKTKNSPAKSDEKYIISTSGIKADDLVQLAKWSDQFKIPVLPDLTGSNTLILATDAQFVVTKRTMKYFEGLLQPEKYKLVSSLWIDACLKAKKLLSHDAFCVKGDQMSIKQRRGSKTTTIATLLASHRFYFYGTFNQPPPDQLTHLIELTGSEVIRDVTELPTTAKSYKCMVLVDASNQVDYERDAEIIRRFPILSATWLLDCFSCQRVLDYKEYLLL